MGGALRRADWPRYAAANGIRGGLEKSMGRTLSLLLSEREPIDLSSGDLPKCMGKRYPAIEAAVRNVGPDFAAYDNPAYRQAQQAVMQRLGGVTSDRKRDDELVRAQVIPGISPFMVPLTRVLSGALLGDNEDASPVFVVIPPLHPNWISSIVEAYGYSSIVTIKRTSNGNPDLEDAARVFRSIDRPFVVIISPDENPAGVCSPNWLYHNEEGTGILDLVRGIPPWGTVVFDAIYSDFSWGPNADKRHELREVSEKLGIRMLIAHSLSKVYGMPGLRIGGVYYAGPMDQVGMQICHRLHNLVNSNIRNGISSPALEALKMAYGDGVEIECERKALLEEVRQRVEVNDRLILDAGMQHVFPDAQIQTAFYGYYTLPTDPKTPWLDRLYRQRLIDYIQTTLTQRGAFSNIELRFTWENARDIIGKHGISASRAFAIALATQGLMCLPHDPFYPMFVDDSGRLTLAQMQPDGTEAINLRFILAATQDKTSEAIKIVKKTLGGIF